VDRDIFVVFKTHKKLIGGGDITYESRPQMMGAFYSQESAYKEVELLESQSTPGMDGEIIHAWVERTKISR